MDFELDAIDRSLCTLLRADGRRSNTDLARELNVSESLVRKKLKRLIGAGFLRVVAAANPHRLGYEIDVWFGLEVDPASTQSVVAALNSLEAVRFIAVVSGSFGIFFEALFRTQKELYEFLSHTLGTIAGINSVQTWHMLRVDKRNFDWMFSFDEEGSQ